MVVRHPNGLGTPKMYDLWAWTNDTAASPNTCIFGGHGLVPKVPTHSGSPFACYGGIRFAKVGFPPCGRSWCPPTNRSHRSSTEASEGGTKAHL